MRLQEIICPVCYNIMKFRLLLKKSPQEVKCIKCRTKIILDVKYIREGGINEQTATSRVLSEATN